MLEVATLIANTEFLDVDDADIQAVSQQHPNRWRTERLAPPIVNPLRPPSAEFPVSYTYLSRIARKPGER
jgi:hypothetical protein